MPRMEVAYLGPVGTYSHLVAEKRFGRRHRLLPLPNVTEVFAYVSRHRDRFGIVPIENSSGGAIYETVDLLMERRPPVHILEELSLNVRLALLGRKGRRIRALFSHFAPLEHCAAWLKRSMRGVEKHAVSSTAAAAQRAASEPGAAALGSRRLAGLYGLDVLEYPVQADLPNITVFLVIAGASIAVARGPTKISLAVKLLNRPGSLCTFLDKFRAENVNLSRLLSRPIRGCPRQYAFLVDIEGSPSHPPVQRALREARKACSEMTLIGSFPSRRPYQS